MNPVATGDADALLVHATTVAFDGRGVLIFGPSGSGKSALGLHLMAWGARLVSDDQSIVVRRDAALHVHAPAAIFGRIEARGVGILLADALTEARLVLAIDLGTRETERLPPERTRDLLGFTVPLLHNSMSSHFPVAIVQYMKAGRSA